MPRRWSGSALAVVVCVTVGACGSGSGGGKALPPETVQTAPPQTTTTNPLAVPAIIDAAYASRVMVALDAMTGDIVRMIVSSKTIPSEAVDRLKAIYTSDAGVNVQLDNYSRDLSTGLKSYQPNPGNKRSTVLELLSVTPRCFYFRVQRDYSAVGINAATALTEWIALQTSDPARDPHGYNKTGWSYRYEGYTAQRTQPAQDPCTV